MRLFFSFACDDGFLGAVVMPEGEPREQLARLTAAGLNPGGEVMIMGIPAGNPLPVGRLLSVSDLEAADGPVEFLGGLAEERRDDIEAAAEFVREAQNPMRPS